MDTLSKEQVVLLNKKLRQIVKLENLQTDDESLSNYSRDCIFSFISEDYDLTGSFNIMYPPASLSKKYWFDCCFLSKNVAISFSEPYIENDISEKLIEYINYLDKINTERIIYKETERKRLINEMLQE